MADRELPELPQRIVGINLPPAAYTARAVGRAQVPDYRYRTDVASIRILLNGFRKWQPDKEYLPPSANLTQVSARASGTLFDRLSSPSASIAISCANIRPIGVERSNGSVADAKVLLCSRHQSSREAKCSARRAMRSTRRKAKPSNA